MKKTAIDLFAGAGGFSLGLEWAGWEVVEAFEWDKDCVATYKANFPSHSVQHTDVRDVDFTRYEGVDLIVGGPPCQPFSNGGKLLGESDERNMVPEFIRAVREARPKYFVMENVPGLLSRRNKEYFLQILSLFEEMGYAVTEPEILNAADYGVPQFRKRVFVIGSQNGVIPYPERTHGEEKQPYVGFRQSTQHLVKSNESSAKVVYTKNPVLRKSPYAGFLVNGRGHSFDLSRPAPTILAQSGGNGAAIVDESGVLKEYHTHLMNGGKPRTGEVAGVRRVTIAESKVLQSFPTFFNFIGSKTSQRKQIGNAVPPLLAEKVVEILLDFPETITSKVGRT